MQQQFQQQQSFIQNLMQLQQNEHTQGMELDGAQRSAEQQQFDRDMAAQQAQQAHETPPAGG